MVSFLFGCRKYDSLPNTNSPNYAQLQQQFFNTGTTADIAIKKLAADIRRQDSLFHFLPAFVKKNGIPRWDKVVYSSNHSNSGSQLSTYGVNAAGSLTKHSQNSTNEGSQGIFFIPLQAQNANTIQSYIVAYKHNDSLYTYRLYNRDSLNAIRPKTSIAKNNLLNTQAVFGYFEQTVNNRDGITIESPVSGKIKNVEIAFHATRNNHVNSTQSLNGTMASVSCEMSIEVTISYSLEVTLDGNTIYITESYSVSLTIIIDCTGGGSCNCATPKDNIIDGVGGTGNTNGNWWDYGTGYPYFPWNPSGISGGSGPYEPDWSWWWTGFGGGGGGATPLQNFVTTLSPSQTYFWNDPNNFFIVSTLTNRLNQSNYSLEEQDFVRWAIDYLSNNPSVNFQDFYNQFLSPDEGLDESSDLSFWDVPNNTFPPQNLPAWSSFESAYPKRSDPLYDSPAKLYASIGGAVLTKVGPNSTANTCAARVSKALNYSGVNIPHIPNQTYQGSDGKYYFLGAENLNRWMRKTFGCANPNTAIGEYYNANSVHYNASQAGTKGANLPSLLTGIKGIYSMVSSNYNWATGHADILFPNATCDPNGGCHFDGPIRYIDVWKLQ